MLRPDLPRRHLLQIANGSALVSEKFACYRRRRTYGTALHHQEGQRYDIPAAACPDDKPIKPGYRDGAAGCGYSGDNRTRSADIVLLCEFLPWDTTTNRSNIHTCGQASRFHQLHGLFVKGDEGFRAQPASFMGNHPIGEVTACIKNRQPCFRSRSVDNDIRDCPSSRRIASAISG